MAVEYLYIIAVLGMSYYYPADPGHLNLYISGYKDTDMLLDLPWTDNMQRIVLTEGNNRTWNISYRFTADQEKKAVEAGIRLTTTHPVSVQVSRSKWYTTLLTSYTAFSLKDYSTKFYLTSQPKSPIGLSKANPVYTLATGTEPAMVTLSRRMQDGSFDKVVSHHLLAHSLIEVTVSNTTYDNLTGIHVRSDAPIAVFSGHQCGNVPTDVYYCQPLFQQILPLVELGGEYIAGPIAERNDSGYTIRIIFTQADTALDLTNAGYSLLDVGASNKCQDSQCVPLQPGDYLEFRMTNASTSSLITCSKPCYVYQFNHGGDGTRHINTNPFMMPLQPLTQMESSLKFSTISIFNSGSEVPFLSFITVVTQTGSRINLDEAEVTNPQRFGDWDVYSKEIDHGFHMVSTVDGQSVTMAVQVYGHGFNFSGGTAYGFPVAFSDGSYFTGVSTDGSGVTFSASSYTSDVTPTTGGISSGLMIALIVIAVLVVIVIVLVVMVIYIIRRKRGKPNLSSSAIVAGSHQSDIPSVASRKPLPCATHTMDELNPTYGTDSYYYSLKTGQVNPAILRREYENITRSGADAASGVFYETPVVLAEDTYEEI